VVPVACLFHQSNINNLTTTRGAGTEMDQREVFLRMGFIIVVMVDVLTPRLLALGFDHREMAKAKANAALVGGIGATYIPSGEVDNV